MNFIYTFFPSNITALLKSCFSAFIFVIFTTASAVELNFSPCPSVCLCKYLYCLLEYIQIYMSICCSVVQLATIETFFMLFYGLFGQQLSSFRRQRQSSLKLSKQSQIVELQSVERWSLPVRYWMDFGESTLVKEYIFLEFETYIVLLMLKKLFEFIFVCLVLFVFEHKL